ncbi:hypothetical protein ACFQFQ_33575 [Sulfitobacter porphyrae]|uniref:Uncharacterized protein n=1 Tax=Sulfitobacter porphyrae TaxID=1246864 RepID=A0ABW2BAR2_9RHOB|nr:hypothetical protein GCM10007928_51690 [Sulfitobacter porphyrae]
MTTSISRIFLAAAIFTVSTAALADETFPFLEPDAIRSAYELNATDWSSAPAMIVNAFVAAEE